MMSSIDRGENRDRNTNHAAALQSTPTAPAINCSRPEVEHDVPPVLPLEDQHPAHLGTVQLQPQLKLCASSISTRAREAATGVPV